MKILLSTALLLISGSTVAATIPTNLSFPLKNGGTVKTYNMADHPNSVFVFEAYQNFCGECNNNAANVEKLATDYKNNPRVQVLDSSLDTQEIYFKQWIQKHQPNHPVIADTGRRVFDAFKVDSVIPQVFIVNCKGELAGTHIGAWDAALAAQIRGEINEALKTNCATAEEEEME